MSIYNNSGKKTHTSIYNTPKIKEIKENEEKSQVKPTSEIKILQEAHITEITLGSQTFRVMDAGHIQGVINIIEKQDSSIKMLNKTVNTLTKTVNAMNQKMNAMQKTIDDLKGKHNDQYL